ncbi:MAG: hypothetical protein NC420_01755 [Eubacterium sp.]|nr:hypothetical protein [Eubacterium sp.]
MENNYQNLQYTDDEKVMEYIKAIIKAVDMTHQVAAKAQMKSKKAREAIESRDKEFMWNTLQEYLHKYKDFINTKSMMCICNVEIDFYNQVTVPEIEQQLKIIIGVVYDYEAKYCVHNEMIKQCLKKLLKSIGVFTDKEIERILL